jgi:hypothetical protein
MERGSDGKLLEAYALYDTTYVVEILARDLQHGNLDDTADAYLSPDNLHSAIPSRG